MLKLSSHLCNYSVRILFNYVDDFSAVPFNGLVFQHFRKLTMAPKKSKRSASDDSSSDSGPDDVSFICAAVVKKTAQYLRLLDLLECTY